MEVKKPNGKLRFGYLDLGSYKYTLVNETAVSLKSFWSGQSDKFLPITTLLFLCGVHIIPNSLS